MTTTDILPLTTDAELRQYYPPELTKEEFYRKITAACKKVGINDIIIREWDRDSASARFTDGVIREQQYEIPGIVRIPTKDIAYLVNNSWHNHPPIYHVDMVHINYDNFNKKKGKQFANALRQQGLEPFSYHPSCGPVFPTPEMIEADKNRDKTALYK